nr:cache domain-containing protein [Prolixibacteraceae bacterium]
MKKLLKAGFFQKIFLPAMLAILLFVISSFVFIIPAFEKNAITQKKNMLLELTNTAWSILQKYQTVEASGLLTRQEAQEKAIDEIKSLRYGPDQKDYFWITDLTPIMVMHPYVQELNGKSLRNFSDPDGIKVFMEALNIVENNGEGFMQYKWQFKDDPEHIDPKLSFVKKFEHWNWIIGTGLYLHDVKVEISRLTNRLLIILIGITFIITLIILFITFQSLTIENKRRAMELQLHESKEKYKSLLESSTEGIILLLNKQISYTNTFIQNWLQCSAEELQQKTIDSLFASEPIPEWDGIGKETRMEVLLKKRDSSQAEAVLTMLPVCFADKEGLLLTFRDTHEYRTTQEELKEVRNSLRILSDHTGVGLIRFELKEKSKQIDFNRNVATMLGYANESELRTKRLDQVLGSREELKKILKEINRKQSFTGLKISLRKKDNGLTESLLHLTISKSANRDTFACNGILEPVHPFIPPEEYLAFGEVFSQAFARNLQPAVEYSLPLSFCPGNASIRQAIEIMVENRSSFLIILLEGKNIGIVTQKDILYRGLSNNLPLDQPVSTCMTAPLITADQQITIEEAYALMEQESISHLVLINHLGESQAVVEKGKLVGIYTNTPKEIALMLERCSNSNELAYLRKKQAFLVKPILNELGRVQTACAIIKEINEQITIRIIENTLRELGPPPVAWAFISVGSAGRGELVFNSDQDNAILFDDHPDIPREAIQHYFLQLASKICSQLDNSGLPFCTGKYMASNPRWCQPLQTWKEYFNEW